MRPSTPTKTTAAKGRRLGVWLLGARGGLATTVVTGAAAISRRLHGPTGLLTETGLFAGLPLVGVEDLVFGGHDIRRTTTLQAAIEVGRDAKAIDAELCRRLKPDFARFDRDVRPGTLRGCGPAIAELADSFARRERGSLRTTLARLRRDLVAFRRRHRLERVIVVNLTSTEPPVELGAKHQTLARLDRALDADDDDELRPSLLYAYAAAAEGCPFIHFTPSNATLVPAVQELFARQRQPFMGADGKTGETLVKSALAPMFKYRNLRVLAWQGYNLLGDRDGIILSNPDNKRSKVASKDALLHQILGYPLQTHVEIDYVPSLGDLKTAWDYIHFEGFLGFRMHMQFTWHGCDAILAAPLVLDMVRLVDYAASRGESGPLPQLACFFKRPLGVATGDLHDQWHLLEGWARREREQASGQRPKGGSKRTRRSSGTKPPR